MVFNTGPYTVLPDISILITADMQLETSFPSSHQLKSYVASKSRLKLAARAVLSADAGLLVRVEWDVKPQLNQSTPMTGGPMLQAKLTSLSEYSMDVRRLFPLDVVSLRQ